MAGFSWAVSSAQEKDARLLLFTPSTIEIDTVRYDGGPVEVTFSFQNVSGKPVTLLDVRPQCGCTVPVYSRSAVGPGKKGTVKVTFDPSQTYGEQKRYLTVVSTNGDYRKLNTIQVHGYVRRDQTPSEIRFPFHLGAGIRTELETVGLRKRKAGETVRRTIVLYNDSPAAVKLSRKRNRRIRGDLEKDVLAPGERTALELVYHTRGLKKGDFSDALVLRADGKDLKPILLQGTIE